MSLGHRAAILSTTSEAPEAPEAYLPMVEALARRLARRLPSHVELDDLISVGVVGLMEALQRYDPSHRVAFRPYAHTRVRGAMLDELRRRDLMARDARLLAKRIARATGEVRVLLGRSPEDEELANHLGVNLEVFHDWLTKVAPIAHVSLEAEGQQEVASVGQTPHEHVAERQAYAHLVENIARLPQRTQDILHLYYAVELTLSDVGEVVGVSESRVSQIITRATLELQTMMADSAATKSAHGRIHVGRSS